MSEYILTERQEFKDIINNKQPKNNILLLKNYVTENNIKYKIINYDKKYLCSLSTFLYYGIYRSLILDEKNNVLCFSPVKTISFEYFINKYPNKTEDIIAEEFIEGTMINLFYDKNINKWEISTKKSVSANVYFYKNLNSKSFNAMFYETLNYIDFNIEEICDKKLCYSFVLQHPENRIVVPFKYPKLYLIDIYQIETKEDIDKNKEIIVKTIFNWKNDKLSFPIHYTKWNNYNDLLEKYCSDTTSYETLGVIIKNIKTGERCKIRNPEYLKVKELQGNICDLEFRYLILRKQNKIEEYLKYFPENYESFLKYEKKINVFCVNLYNYYYDCFIKKIIKISNCIFKYKPHLYNLHNIYINELKQKKLYINYKEIEKYINNIDVELLMFSLKDIC